MLEKILNDPVVDVREQRSHHSFQCSSSTRQVGWWGHPCRLSLSLSDFWVRAQVYACYQSTTSTWGRQLAAIVVELAIDSNEQYSRDRMGLESSSGFNRSRSDRCFRPFDVADLREQHA